MPTLDRTTIKAVMDELVSKLGSNLASDPPTAAKPFRKVAGGVGDPEHFPRPFLAVRPVRARAVSAVDGDKVIELMVELRIVADILGVDPLTAVYDQMGAVEDYLDSILESGVIDGAAGFDDRSWALDVPRATSGARVATATAQQTLMVKVQRGFNRTPAP